MSEADVKFLQDMIAHHQAALDMSRKYLKDNSPTVRQARVSDLARQIIEAQTTEIALMTTWLRSAGKQPTNGGGHMSGMKM